MTRTQVYLDDKMLMQIKLEAQLKGVKMSEFIRQLLAQGFETLPKTKTKNNGFGDMIGKYKTGGFDCKPEELSKKLDEIIYVLPYENQ